LLHTPKRSTQLRDKIRNVGLSLAFAAAASFLGIATAYAGTPYTGTPIAVPSLFEAENFDKGGEGIAYHDLTPANQGGYYRLSEGVDIIANTDPEGGGGVVQWFATGEWVAYTINVPADGNYDIALKASNSGNTGAGFHAEIDGVNVTNKVVVPSTGSWSKFQWVGKTGVPLKAGQHVLKIVADQQYFDFNQVRILQSGSSTVPYAGTPYTGTPIQLPRMFEAENFDKGGNGVAYKDVSAGNSFGQYRTSEDVDIGASGDSAGGGYTIGSFQTGEWLAYTVNVPSAGNYDLSVRASSNYAYPSAFHVEVDGVNVTGSISVPKTGSWNTFQWVGKQGIPLTAGKHVLKLVADAEYFNVNQISVLASASTGTGATPPPDSTVPVVPGAISGKGYRLVKNWDFAAGIRSVSALQSEFYPFYIWGNGTLNYLSGNNEWQRYRDFTNGNHVFTAEGLALRAFLRSGQPLAAGNIDSGMLRSRWYGQYGYFEAKIKVPPGTGMWPAFWLISQDQKWPPEIDVMEIVNNGRDTTRNSFHYLHGPNNTTNYPATFTLLDQWQSYRPGWDFKDDFHTFAVEWTPDRVRHFVDDKLVADRAYRWLHNDNSDGGPAHLVLNLAVGGNWPGAPSAGSLPGNLVVKHIRVWQK
jgi:Beta-glucanase/Beta-glucan synthetase